MAYTILIVRTILKSLKVFALPLITLCSYALCTIALMSACTVHAVDSKGGQEMLTINGKIRLVGNEPFTHLVITTDDDKDYLIQGDLEKELRAFQYQRVTVTGEKLSPKGEFKYRLEVKEYKIIDSAH